MHTFEGPESEPETDWCREKAFWAACKVQTYNLEYSGGYGGGWDVVEQPHDPSGMNHGDYVRADDFRAENTQLRAELATAREQLAAGTRPHDETTIRELTAENERLEARIRELEGEVGQYRESMIALDKARRLACTPEERAVLGILESISDDTYEYYLKEDKLCGGLPALFEAVLEARRAAGKGAG